VKKSGLIASAVLGKLAWGLGVIGRGTDER
jgi:hypothetical protein